MTDIINVVPLRGLNPGDRKLPGFYPIGRLIRHQGCVYTAISHEGGGTVLARPLEFAHPGVAR